MEAQFSKTKSSKYHQHREIINHRERHIHKKVAKNARRKVCIFWIASSGHRCEKYFRFHSNETNEIQKQNRSHH